MADEVVGLPTGFLYAGARTVVSTLWRVFDLSSALLVSKFHQQRLAGNEVGAALRSAQLWLRDEIPSGRHLRRELLPQLLEGVSPTPPATAVSARSASGARRTGAAALAATSDRRAE
jgi:CHAT domain-containing protein